MRGPAKSGLPPAAYEPLHPFLRCSSNVALGSSCLINSGPFNARRKFAWAKKLSCRHLRNNPPGTPVASGANPSRRQAQQRRAAGLAARVPQLKSAQNAICALRHTCPPLQPSARSLNAKKDKMPPKPATKDADDAQKQRQTNLEIDLLKSAWIQKDRESPPVSGKK